MPELHISVEQLEHADHPFELRPCMVGRMTTSPFERMRSSG
jgi:hypothetical protein